MEENIKTRVVGVDISNELTTFAIVDIRGNIIAEDSFVTTDYQDVNNFVSTLSERIVSLVEKHVGY
jgi:glucokinase